MINTRECKEWLKLPVTLVIFIFLLGRFSYAEDELSADDRLDALRQSLLDEALSGEVDVVSSAYVDSSGQLHESAYITANKSVRGVRVSDYVNPEPTNSSVPVRRRDKGSCHSSRYRRQLVVSAYAAGNTNTRAGSVYLSAIVSQSREMLLSKLRNNQLIVTIESDKGIYLTEYDAILARVDQGVGSYELDLEIGLSTSDAGIVDKGIYRAGKAANGIWQHIPFFNVRRGSPADIAAGITYKIHVRQVDQPGAIYTASKKISFRSEPEPTRGTNLPNGLREKINETLESVVEEALKVLLCEPERIVTRRHEGGTHNLLAGQEAGIKSGDQFLLVRSATWDREKLNIDDVAEIALARVEFVYQNEAAIKVIAGPNAPDAGNLIAIPF